MTTKTRACSCGATYADGEWMFSGPESVSPAHWHGAPAISSLLLPVGEIERWPGNPRQGDVGAIVESLRRFGQQKPIVVQHSTMFVAAGNHLLDAVKALGWTHIAVNVTDLSDREAEAYLIADNRTAELGSYDENALGDFLRKLAEDGNLRGTGYDGEDVDEFLKRLARDEKPKPELVFSLELMESHNYVVLYFDNDLDWNAAKTKLGIETVSAPDATDTYDRRGVGRIIRGVDVLGMIPD